VKVRLIVYSSDSFGFRTTFNASVAYLNYELADRTTTSLFGKTIKLSEGVTIYLNPEKVKRSFNSDLTRIVEVEIESFKDRLTLVRQRKS
jgi:hypothetical protein